MQRPEVRIIETQSEETRQVDVSNWEKQQLLAKYGYINQIQEPISQIDEYNPVKDLSYAELMRIEDEKYLRQMQQKMQEMINRPKSYTIDSDQVRFNETRWSNIDGTNLGFEVNIVSDMKIPGQRY
jgi:hypothetical protein